MAKLNRSNYPEGHNYLINGGFDIWQRGVATTGVHNAYFADRWKWIRDAGDTVTLSQSGTAPGYDAGTNALLIQAVAGGSTYSYFGQPIEDVQILSNTKIRVSAWLYPTGGMIGATMYFYAEQQFGSGGSSAVAADTVAFVTVAGWQKISLTLDIPSVIGKTVGVNDNLFVVLQTPANTTGNLYVGKFKVQKGTRETPFIYRSNELDLCHRYYQQGAIFDNISLGNVTSVSQGHRHFFSTYMRATPTLGTSFSSGAGAYIGSTMSSPGATQQFLTWSIVNSGTSAGGTITWTADAEL